MKGNLFPTLNPLPVSKPLIKTVLVQLGVKAKLYLYIIYMCVMCMYKYISIIQYFHT